MREIKFRAWNRKEKLMSDPFGLIRGTLMWRSKQESAVTYASLFPEYIVMQYTGLKDKNGKEIYEGDILEFSDKWEWYRGSYGIKMHFAEPEKLKELQKQYDAEPMERRVIEIPNCYEWILSSEIQSYWHVIGNIHQNTELLTP